jgi:hypothetical protein
VDAGYFAGRASKACDITKTATHEILDHARSYEAGRSRHQDSVVRCDDLIAVRVGMSWHRFAFAVAQFRVEIIHRQVL